MRVLKANGESEEFDAEKVRRACLRAGASDRMAEEITQSVRARAYDGIPTHEIYAMAYKLLKQAKTGAEHRFSLKKAMMELGPEGHAFEDFVARVFQANGYQARTRQIVKGKCVSHEVDVVAENAGEKVLVECKFHHRPGIECHVQNPLYVWARFQDVVEGAKSNGERPFTQAWLATNTRLSSDAVAYAECVGLKVLGWKYPSVNGLEALIEQKRLYPVTVLTGLTSHEKDRLVGADILLLRELVQANAAGLAAKTGLPAPRIEGLKAQVHWL
ncbi:MAG: restriction endonuclease [Candidatus Diapherotrites archaeon]|uniref:Restriction endonuclease n=1 Tax=Candidatus Iainarchaeum sp. TaxID=3101447 RepID=A0A8T4LH79_9ARCH|nr:restriction endonuclease [Candidatus Diapherotrites archaeon]